MQNVVSNIRPALEKLAPKMREDGVVAWTLYSAFWNATTDACDHETWAAVSYQKARRLIMTDQSVTVGHRFWPRWKPQAHQGPSSGHERLDQRVEWQNGSCNHAVSS